MSVKKVLSLCSYPVQWIGLIILLVLIELISWKLVDVAFVLTILSIIYYESRYNSWRGIKDVIQKLRWVNILILVWIASSILGYFLSVKVGQEQIDEILGLRWIVTFYACVYLGSHLKINEKGLKVFLLSFLILLLLGIGWQYLLTYRHGRLEGTFVNANIFAYTIAMPWIALIAWESCDHQRTKRSDWFYGAIILSIAIAIFFTFGRGTWIAMCFLLVVVSALTGNKRNFLAMAIGLLLFGALYLGNAFGLKDRLLYSLDFSAGSAQSVRLGLWKANWAIFQDHPIFGIGFYENIRMVGEYYTKLGMINHEEGTNYQYLNHAHNQILQVFVGSGLVGGLAYVGLLVTGVVFFLKRFLSSNSEVERKIALVGFSIVLMFIATGIFDCPLMVHESRSYFLMFSGFCAGFLLLGKNNRGSILSDDV